MAAFRRLQAASRKGQVAHRIGKLIVALVSVALVAAALGTTTDLGWGVHGAATNSDRSVPC